MPVYPETEGISSKWLRSRIAVILFKLNLNFPEYLPLELIKKYSLTTLPQAVRQIHFPKTLKDAKSAQKRLSFDELLILSLLTQIKKEDRKKDKIKYKLKISIFKNQLENFIESLPFKLTGSQNNVLNEILSDLERDKPMNRLLQGDVGAGKTVIAVICSYLIHLNGLITLIMSPTEILAKQHYQTFVSLLKSYGIEIVLITGSEKPVKNIKKPSVYIGTHALLNQDFTSEKIALVIIDEQQRFGVEQRTKIKYIASSHPHLLTMTATPIPRTVALTIYADLDMSKIDELPHGRLKVKTFVVPPEKRQSAYSWIRREIISSGYTKRAFIICPLIEESETLQSVRSVKKEFEKLKDQIFPDLMLGLIHGRLKAKEKDTVLSSLNSGKIDILVATPVVEVGIDVKTANIMLIEGSDRFGLAQLHQLRGRVGRSDIQSYCLLFTDSNNPETIQRLKIL